MQLLRHKYVALLAGLATFLATKAEAVSVGGSTIQISWNPSTSSATVGYYVCIGTNTGVYFQTNVVPAPQNYTSLNLSGAAAYYLAVAAFDSNNNISPLSNEIECTNGVATTNLAGTGGSGGTNQPPSFQDTNNPVTGGGSGSSNTPSISSPPTFASLWGIPPYLTMGVSNAQPVLNVVGTVGATMNIECSTSPNSLASWTLLTNIVVTNVAPIASSNQPANPDALDLAFVPGAQQFFLPPSETNMLFYRAVMPYDYAVLAGQVLPQKGYPSRLIAVTMPGLNDDACYVTPESSYIHYLNSSNTFELRGSGSTIRNIADTLSQSLNQTWTTASEFVFTNGVGEILATVVATEDPANDPVAGSTPTSQIVINF